MLRRPHKSVALTIGGRSAGPIGRHPREAVALLLGATAFVSIVANALFLQHGPHPAPIFATRPVALPQPAPVRKIVAPAAVPVPPAAPQKAAVQSPHNDPIAALIAPSKRIEAVQRVLTEFGYGQIRPTGLFGPETRDAIEKFERQHKMPVTGQMSERLTRALATMTGRALD